MVRIDIVGAGGVGKTTFVKNLKLSRKASGIKWLDESEALKRASFSSLSDLNDILGYFLKIVPKSLHPYMPNILSKELLLKFGGKFGDNYFKNNREFLKVINVCIERPNQNELQKVNFLYHFVHVIRKIAYIDHYLKEDCVIWDESLTHKMFAVIPWEDDSADLVKLYCESLPLPEGIIYLKDEPENIAKKINNRSISGVTVVAHANLEQEHLINLNYVTNKLVEISIDVMKSRGVKVFELDAAEVSETNIQKSNKFILSLLG